MLEGIVTIISNHRENSMKICVKNVTVPLAWSVFEKQLENL